ncbi:MAG: hypothetical protein H0V89_09250 [Deltaproteobacteria bacterium]|nr:hypothetical protein [Deltaproteobacteria bacterium]
MNYCTTPVLVGLDHPLPSDPSIAYNGTPPAIGCNHLVCSNCGAVVRHADSRSITSNHAPPEAELQKLYDAKDPAGSPLLDSAPLHRKSRAYFCRCDWNAVDLGGTLYVGSSDQPWRCAGHGPTAPGAHDTQVAAAREATDALVAAAVPIFVPDTGAKIQLRYAGNVNPAFSTASELRDNLLASYPDAAHFRGPLVGRNREDTAPAWGWVRDFLLMRSDWRPALGIALQHAATNGGELAQTALVELLAHFKESFALLPWTAPMAELWPDRRTVSVAATGWGGPDYRLDAVIRDQKKHVVDVGAGKARAFLSGYGVDGKPIDGPLTNEVELRALLGASARAGQSPGGDKGPWSWLAIKFLFGDAWLRPAFVRIVETIDGTDQAMTFALLDWFFEESDLWQFSKLLEKWVADPPPWWATPSNTKPTGWKRTIRSSFWPGVKTLGDLATEALRRAKWQVVTPPVIDLPQLYG